ncbi:hypothetical protein P7228_11200 [Altererythrobacter arenosus]|uniref:Uncharacterized protein n=1 Tax=Altererythrobacter arenosus TaxID=3032592 RepID=A0ABY8FNF5_9SPHN|nr:hypothetical protein [Altererythrobacter sp. CAU 1644]WFL76560.1 hypothetical protein P7228_11200 [Altererythrobacter sp. CAU 1644]
MSEKRRLSPAEKKALSYANDRRNAYGENDKAARKAIPARKAGENRKNRRKAAQALESYEALDEGSAALVESSLTHDVERVGGWKKCPDQPLEDHIAQQNERRDFRDGRKKWVGSKLTDAKEQGHTAVSYSWRGSDDKSDFDSQ